MKHINFYGEKLNQYKSALHTHCTVSDGRFTPQQVIEMYARKDFDVLAFTDHRKTNPVSTYDGLGMTLISGAEIHPPQPRGTAAPWHILALGVPEDFPTLYDSPQQAVDAIRGVGGAVFCAHPYWCGFTAAEVTATKGYYGIEVWNSSCQEIDRCDSSACWDEILDFGSKYTALAVDDIHSINEYAIGWTMVAAADSSQDSIVDALKNGKFYATQGPVITALSWDGKTFSLECSPIRHIFPNANGTTGGYLQPQVQRNAEGRIVGFRCDASGLMSHKGVTYMRFKLLDDQGKAAWTNPIFFQ